MVFCIFNWHVLAVVACTFAAKVTWLQVATTSPWGVRAMPRGGIIGDNVFVIGGRDGATKLYGDTWRSTDSVHWTQMSDSTGWKKRAYLEVSVVNSSLILSGGQSLTEFYNDVWRSDDLGSSWKCVNPSAPWHPRAGHFTLVLNGTILLFAGSYGSFNRVFYNELWKSSDGGVTWKLTALPPDMGRAGMQVVALNHSLYFMGGDHDNPVFQPNFPGRRNDVWRSDDGGESWILLGNASWSPRTGQQCAATHDSASIICVGGEGQGVGGTAALLHDVWLWTPATMPVSQWEQISFTAWGCSAAAASCGRDDFMLLRMVNGTFYTYGGDEATKAPTPQDNDVWMFTVDTTVH